MGGNGAKGTPLPRTPESPDGFLIQHAPDSCVECWGCVRVCPARALRVVDGHAEVMTERCVKCGLCVSICGSASHFVRDDTTAVRELLRGSRPVVALLASECAAALHPSTSQQVESSLETLGFTAVETSVPGEELVADAYDRWYGQAQSALPRLRSTCPVTVDWVRRYHPQLTGALVPIVPPYVAQALLIREVYEDDVAVVYVSPCYARKDEVFEPSIAGAVDAVIDFTELKRLMVAIPPRPGARGRRVRRAHASKELSLTDGFPRRMLAAGHPASGAIAVVRGLDALDELLTAIERGETAPNVVDMLLCDGCIDGPAVSPNLSVFAKRGIVVEERAEQGPSPVDSRSFLAALPSVDLHRSFTPDPVLQPVPTADEIDGSLAQGGIGSRDDSIDCGACGFSTCVEHAEAVLLGLSDWQMCFPLQRRKLAVLADELDRLAARDSLTGLYNRRAFDERLEQEVSRSVRHKAPLSLVMVDLDSFKGVNDGFGHPAGDSVLTAFAAVLRQELRVSDVACRYGGDEFAVILPDTGKTEAFAVAEKLREALAARPLALTDGRSVAVTASLGVATLGALAADGPALLLAADQALYAAKADGRDRTNLSAG